jgi:hypothetical protein
MGIGWLEKLVFSALVFVVGDLAARTPRYELVELSCQRATILVPRRSVATLAFVLIPQSIGAHDPSDDEADGTEKETEQDASEAAIDARQHQVAGDGTADNGDQDRRQERGVGEEEFHALHDGDANGR